MIILGAGLSGLIAGNMLRRFEPTIYEAQASLPNNHAALLRFKTDAVSLATAIPFKKVWMQKGVWFDGKLQATATFNLQNMYSSKVTGSIIGRSIGNLESAHRYIAPQDFIAQSAKNLRIEYNQHIDLDWAATLMLERERKEGKPIISTIPMDYMMGLTGWRDKPDFKFQPIWSVTADITADCDVYQTVYFPSKEDAPYRVSITGNKLIVEYLEETTGYDFVEHDMLKILNIFGISSTVDNIKVKHQKYGKSLPLKGEEEKLRKRFILWLTEKYGIYSLGRHATWRQLQLCDVVKDVNVIEGLMNSTGYERVKRGS